MDVEAQCSEGHKYRADVLDPQFAASCFYGLKPVVLHNYMIAGTWQRIEKGKDVRVEIMPFRPGKPIPVRALDGARKKYISFSLASK